MSNRKLIADIGMHDGRDTDFYLKKGFRVVAVEANPQLAEMNMKQFARYIKEGDLTIINAALGDFEGPVSFYVNDRKSDWSSIHRSIADRDGGGVRVVEVPSMRASEFFNLYKEIFYAKIDIEGADGDALLGMMKSACRPVYLSAEASNVWLLGVMRGMGYREFKMINQSYYFDWCLPNPAVHGDYIDYQFKSGSSGPFGEEAAGEWKDVNTIAEAFSAVQRAGEILPGQMIHSWWDFHAKR